MNYNTDMVIIYSISYLIENYNYKKKMALSIKQGYYFSYLFNLLTSHYIYGSVYYTRNINITYEKKQNRCLLYFKIMNL